MNNTIKLINFIKSLYNDEIIPLHRPMFIGNEKQYLIDCIESNFVSSAGEMVSSFEKKLSKYTNSKFCIAVSNGTAALHISLKVLGVKKNTEVITQALNFVAIGNAISYCAAKPIFIDVEKDTLGLCPNSLKKFLKNNVYFKKGKPFNKKTNKLISACVPMHTFGNPCRILEISQICKNFNIPLLEDAAESLGSFYNNKHTGTFGLLGVISFNGNKIITTGSGGAIITDDENLAKKIKHLTTTAKLPHRYEYIHDEIGYNYRLSSINAVLGIAQLENLDFFIDQKTKISNQYKLFCIENDIKMVSPIEYSKSNYWLNAIIMSNFKDRNNLLNALNDANIFSRPIWKLLSTLEMFKDCENDGLINSNWLEKRVINLPSSVPNI